MKPGKLQSISLYLALALSLIAILLALVLRPDAGTPPDFLRFLGRFHTLAVHLPIGIITLVAIAELVSFSKRARPKVDPVIGFALPVVAITAVAAFTLGLLLARGGGYPSKLIFWHRALTLASIALLPICAGLWGPVQRTGNGRWLYRGVLFSAVGLMSIGAHFGGSMTKGENYLVQFAPKFARGLLGVKEPEPVAETPLEPTGEPLVWQHSVQPLLQQHCVECHGPEEAKGGLRLDSLASALKGGDEGNTIVPGNAAKSSLVSRMKLPKDSDERMPPDGKAGPSDAEIALIAWWVDRGANDQLKVREGITPAPVSELLEKTLSQAVAAAPTAAAGEAGAKSPEADAGADAAKTASSDDDDDDDADDDDDSEFGPTPHYGSGSSDDDDDDGGGDTKQVSLTHKSGPVWGGLVGPLLESRCGNCHGAKRQKGKFRVDSLSAVRSGGKAGPGVVPGNPQKGTLLARVHSTKKSEHMPPYNQPQLTDSEVELITWWIKQGADDKVATTALPKSLLAKYGPEAPKPASKPTSGDDDDDDDTDPSDAGAPVTDAGAPTTPDAAPAEPANDTVALYTDIVKPMLAKRCGACHSGDGAMGVHIDDLPGMLEGGDIVAGDPEGSPILARQLVPLEELNHMPPKSEPQPKNWEIEVLRLWIKDGAKADARVALADLPPEAVPQGKGGSNAEEPPAKAGAGGKAGVQTPSTAGGCAACTISPEQASPLRRLALFSLLMGVGALWLRRRRR
ncbi:MAG: c-type cytochrome domain-containing protein [Polyangiaceae bacterium]